MSKAIKSAFLASAFIMTCGTAIAKEMICPSLEAIKAEGLLKARPDYASTYYACQISKYNTDYKWSLFVHGIEASSEEEAKAIGNQLLNQLTSPATAYDDDGDILCKYTRGTEFVQVAAITNEKFCDRVLK